MESLQRGAIIVELCERIIRAGSWCGETHVQKSMYFVQELVGVPTGFDFVLYKFGPFSFDLRESLNVMLADNLLAFKIQAYPYGPRVEPTDRGVRLRDRFRRDVDAYSLQLQFVADTLGNKGVAELERLATALFAWHERGATWTRLGQRIHELKPHVSLEKAQAAVEELQRIVQEHQALRASPSFALC